MKKSFLFILGIATILASCTQDNGGKNERGIIELSPVEKNISKQSNDFAFKLLDAANKTIDKEWDVCYLIIKLKNLKGDDK